MVLLSSIRGWRLVIWLHESVKMTLVPSHLHFVFNAKCDYQIFLFVAIFPVRSQNYIRNISPFETQFLRCSHLMLNAICKYVYIYVYTCDNQSRIRVSRRYSRTIIVLHCVYMYLYACVLIYSYTYTCVSCINLKV